MTQPQPGIITLSFETCHWDGSPDSAMEVKRWAAEHGFELGLWDGNWSRELNSWRSIGKFTNGTLLPGGTALWLPQLGLFALTPEQALPWDERRRELPEDDDSYVPSTEWVRIMVGYAKATAVDRTLPVEAAREQGYRWFDRWLAAHHSPL